MAGRLYAALMHKEVHGTFMPTVLQLHRRLQKLGYMEYLDYSEEEYMQVEQMIDHERDLGYAHYQLHTHLTKYAIAHRATTRNIETPMMDTILMTRPWRLDKPPTEITKTF